MLEVAPVVFLKIGQNNAGSIDFTLASDYSQKVVNGDFNVYAREPFKTKRVNKRGDFLQ